MAPRAPESFDGFVARLTRSLKKGHTEVRFGHYHFSHAVCVEKDVVCVRRLEHTAAEAAAYLKEHGMFMPENAEAISQPRTLVLEAPTVKELIALLAKRRWPVP